MGRLNTDGFARGFDTAAGSFAWGTTFGQLEARGLRPAKPVASPNVRQTEGVDVLGLRCSRMELMAPRPDRPVMRAWYRLDLPEGEAHVDYAMRAHAHLVDALGAPESGDARPVRFEQKNAWSVTSHAEWRLAAAPVRIGVSWYGAPRDDESACRTSGIVFLDWDDEDAAAAPWMAAWQRDQDEVDAMLRDATAVATLEAGPARVQVRTAAQRVLRAPSLHFTRPDFALLQGDVAARRRLVLWRADAADAWGVSDVQDTVCCRRGETLEAEWIQLLPAKGGGSIELSFGALANSQAYRPRERCADIAGFTDILATMPGASFQYGETHDC